MRITRSEEYGIRLVTRLATTRGPSTVGDLAQEEVLPEPTVGKILNRLKAGALVASTRGRGGGFSLVRPADEVTVHDVLAALGERTLSGSACTEGEEAARRCPHVDSCHLRPVWRHLETLIDQVFARTTIADLLEQEGHVRSHLALVSVLPVSPLDQKKTDQKKNDREDDKQKVNDIPAAGERRGGARGVRGR